MRYAVTGGLGFVGSALTTALVEAGHEVLVLDNMSKGSVANLPADVRQASRVETVDIVDEMRVRELLAAWETVRVVHLAAMHFIPECESNPTRAVRINVEGTQALLSSLVGLSSVQSLVFASSAAVYGPSPTPHREDGAVAPMDIYGLTKRWGEELVMLHASRYAMPASIARLFNVYGPGETNPHLIPELLAQALDGGGPIRVGNLDSSRDYVYREDVAEALALLSDACIGKAEPLVCNVGTGTGWTGTEVLHAVERVTGVHREVQFDPGRSRVNDRPVLVADTAKAESELGWRAKTDFEAGLRAAAKWPRATVTS